MIRRISWKCVTLAVVEAGLTLVSSVASAATPILTGCNPYPSTAVSSTWDIIGTVISENAWADLANGNYLWDPSCALWDWMQDPANGAKAVDIAVPLIPLNSDTSGASWNSLLDQGASGAEDAIYVSLGGRLAHYGPATVYARLWWEMNQYGTTQVDPAKFKACWIHAVPLIRSGFAATARPGQTLKIVYCFLPTMPNEMDYYPSDETTVDIIGSDIYADIWGSSIPSLSTLLATVQSRLADLLTNSAPHNKPIAIPEWGNWQQGQSGTTAAHGLGDCPQYIDLMFTWAQQNRPVYMIYFNNPLGGVGQTLANTPLSLARYTAWTGKPGQPQNVQLLSR